MLLRDHLPIPLIVEKLECHAHALGLIVARVRKRLRAAHQVAKLHDVQCSVPILVKLGHECQHITVGFLGSCLGEVVGHLFGSDPPVAVRIVCLEGCVYFLLRGHIMAKVHSLQTPRPFGRGCHAASRRSLLLKSAEV